MKKPIDQQFILKIMALTQQILIDKAKPDHDFDFLDNFLSETPASEQREQNWQQLEQHYFIEQGKKLGEGAVPFSGETEEARQDRKFFIDELYKLLKNQTNNFTQTQFYYPTKVQSKSGDENYVFTGDQMARLYRLSFRISYSFEQQHLGSSTTQSGAINLGDKNENPQEEWAKSMLVQGTNGEMVKIGETDLEQLTQPGKPAQDAAFLALLEDKNVIASGDKLIPFIPITPENSPFLVNLAKHRPEELFRAIPLANTPSFGKNESAELTPFEMKTTLSERQASAAGYQLEDAGVILKKQTFSPEEDAAYFEGEDQNKTAFQAKVALRIDPNEEKTFTIEFEDHGAKKQLKLHSSNLSKLHEKNLHQLFDELSKTGDAEVMSEPFKTLRVTAENQQGQENIRNSREQNRLDETQQNLSKPQLPPEHAENISAPQTTFSNFQGGKKFARINSTPVPQSAPDKSGKTQAQGGITPSRRIPAPGTASHQQQTQSSAEKKSSNIGPAAVASVLAGAIGVPTVTTIIAALFKLK